MSLTRWAIDNNRVTLVSLAVLALLGIQAYVSMPQAEDPGFTVRTALVLTHFPGASPQRVEQLVTDKLEKAIQEIPQLDSIESQSKTGVSIILVNVQESYKEMRPIWDDLRRKVERVTPQLPSGTRPPQVNDEFGDVFGTILTVTGEGFSYAELEDVAEEVRDELLLIPSVAKVEVYGAQQERIFVEYNNARLADLGLSPLQLRNILESRNIINPGGEVRTEHEVIVLEPTGNFESVTDLRRTVLSIPGSNELIYLEDVARVERGYIDPSQTKMRANGEPGLALAISLRAGGNILELGDAVRATMDRIRSSYPIGIEFDFVAFQADSVRTKVDAFVGNLLQAVAIVMLVMLLSLGLRTGLVVASLIPMAMIISFIFMALFDVGINQMSLAALIIALGMLVDNAIVMSESIMVEMSAGKSARDAAIQSAAELRIPLLISSLTTAAAFLPIFLAQSAVGEYTAALFQVVTITLLCSWALALVMIPLLCVLFLKVRQRPTQSAEDGFEARFYRAYRAGLLACLQHRALALAGIAALFVVAMFLFRYVPAIFFPPNDRPTFTAELRLPTGSPLAATEEVVLAVEDFIQRELLLPAEKKAGAEEDRSDGVISWASFIGEGAPRYVLSASTEQASPEYAILLVNTSSRAFVDVAIRRLEEFCHRFPGLETTIEPLANGPPAANPVAVRISGRDQDQVFALVEQVRRQLEQTPGTRGITDNWGSRSKKILVRIDEARAQRAGVTHQDIAVSLQTLLSGLNTTEFREGNTIIPVTLRSESARALEPSRISSLNIFSQSTGRSVPLAQVADIELAWQPSNIRRRNRLQTVTLASDLQPGYTAAEVAAALTPWLEEASADWPVGYSWELGGEEEASATANASIMEQLPIAGLLIVLLLVGQFNSLRRPLIILITIPLGLIGVVAGLLIMRSYFGFMTFLGVVSLAGIVINNAIVLLDRIQIEIDDNGLPAQAAILEAGQRRLRPILLTTMTTLGGLIPLYLGGGPMYEPLAVAVMFGLVFATLLTLGVVPVLYSLFFGVSFRGYQDQDAAATSAEDTI
ncbi:MAG: efflux RND transporter permease subunit [Acidobacteriota bacterium]|nr:efflux RND transporter permease subunit [Acidobacteriota bacterium]